MTNNDLADLIEGLWENATTGEWALYTSNSFRRIGLKAPYKEIIWPSVAHDGQPTLSGPNVERDLELLLTLRNNIPQLLHALRAPDAPCEEPIGFAVRMADGPFVGIWTDRDTAEEIRAKQPPAHNDKVVPVYEQPGHSIVRGQPLTEEQMYRVVAGGLRECVDAHGATVEGSWIGSAAKRVVRQLLARAREEG